MSTSILADFSIFVLSLLVGFEVISKVPSTLHTPLMSAANSIHGIVVAGAMLIAVTADNALGYVLAFIAAAFAAANVTGGYVVTGRMLKMFRKRIAPAGDGAGASVRGSTQDGAGGAPAAVGPAGGPAAAGSAGARPTASAPPGAQARRGDGPAGAAGSGRK